MIQNKRLLLILIFTIISLLLSGCVDKEQLSLLEEELSTKKASLSEMQQKQNEYSEKLKIAEQSINQYELKKSAIQDELNKMLENNYFRLLYRCITKDIDPSVSAIVGLATGNLNKLLEAGTCYSLEGSDTYIKIQDKVNTWISTAKEVDEKITKISDEIREYKNSLASINPDEIKQLQNEIFELEAKIQCEKDFSCKMKNFIDKISK